MMFNQILITVVIVAVFIMYAALSLSAYRMIKQVCQKFLDMSRNWCRTVNKRLGSHGRYAHGSLSVLSLLTVQC